MTLSTLDSHSSGKGGIPQTGTGDPQAVDESVRLDLVKSTENPGSSTTSELPAAGDLLDFDYKPVPVLATVSIFLGVCSFAALISLTGIFVGAVAVLVSVAAILMIALSRGELGGMMFAVGGFVLALGFTAAGAFMQYNDYVNELPEGGYRRVNFPREISEKQLIVTPQGYVVPPDVRPLMEQKLFLKGYMWQSRITHNMTEFILLKDNGECCMGGDPKPWDNIRVVLPKGKHCNYINGLTSVWGTLKINRNPTPDDPAVYLLEADGVEKAKTAF